MPTKMQQIKKSLKKGDIRILQSSTHVRKYVVKHKRWGIIDSGNKKVPLTKKYKKGIR